MARIRLGVRPFDVNDVKLAIGILQDTAVERCTPLIGARTVGSRPGERLKNLVHPGISRGADFRLSFWFPIPIGPFAVVTLLGFLNLPKRDDSLVIIGDSVRKKVFLCRNVITCYCLQIVENELP